MLHTFKCFLVSLFPQYKSLYHFHFVQCFISQYFFCFSQSICLFISSFLLDEFLHQLWLYVLNYLHSFKTLLPLLPNLTFLSLFQLLPSLNSVFSLVFLCPFLWQTSPSKGLLVCHCYNLFPASCLLFCLSQAYEVILSFGISTNVPNSKKWYIIKALLAIYICALAEFCVISSLSCII